MLLLADENVPGAVVAALRHHGHDVLWMHSEAPGTLDSAVLRRAQKEGRLLLTFDKDFGELAFRRGLEASAGVILFRAVLSTPTDTAQFVVAALSGRTDWVGNFAVVEESRIRMRPMPIDLPRE